MPLLNYTTTVPATRSMDEVSRLLAKAGARQVLTDYEAGRVVGLAFSIDTPQGARQYRLPVRESEVLAVLKRQKVSRTQQTPEHAHRVAWRILKDWLEAQLAIAEAGMTSIPEIMLPYMLVGSGGETAYELFVARGELGTGNGAP